MMQSMGQGVARQQSGGMQHRGSQQVGMYNMQGGQYDQNSFSQTSFQVPSPFQAYSPAPAFERCDSNASWASNDEQEELNLHPSLDRLKVNRGKGDTNSILSDAMGSLLASGLPADMTRPPPQKPNNPLQKTESQVIAAQAQQLLVQEKQRRERAQAATRSGSSQINAILASRNYHQKIFLMRHGESEANLARRDVPDPNLTQLGMAQAESWQECIGDLQADIVMVSPLRRAVQTACNAFAYEEVPMVFCRFAREIGWCCNENTIHSTVDSMEEMLGELPHGDEIEGLQSALVAGPDDPRDEISSIQRLKLEIAKRPERHIVVVCHFGVIATLTGSRARNGDIYECEWGADDELRFVERHRTPLREHPCMCM